MKRFHFLLGASLFLAGLAVTAAGSEEVYAKKKVLPKKIQVSGASSQKAFRMTVGNSQKIGYTVTPAKASNKKVTFSTSNKKVAKVTSKGVVKGVKAGNATITIQSKAKKSVKTKIKVAVEKESATPISTYADAIPPVIFPPAGSNVGNDVVAPIAIGTATGLALFDEEGNEIEDGSTVEIEADTSMWLKAVVTPATSMDKVTWSLNFLGGINVYQTGLILVTDDTPTGTTAKLTVSCRSLRVTCDIVVIAGDHEHQWSDYVITEPPECMKEGVEASTCSICGKRRERPAAATGHDFLMKEPLIQEPTCTDVGEAEYECQNCHETKREIVRATGHTWATPGEVLEGEYPTCTKKGKIKYTCTVCEEEKIETMAALGHTWDDGEVEKSPTCTATGTRIYHCTVEGCTGTKKESIPATGHTWTYGEVDPEPTCVLGGRRVSVCLVCSRKTTVSVPALGHDWVVETVESTCTVRGTETSTCQRCEEVRVKSLPLKAHRLEEDYREDVPATCTTVGKQSIHCMDCEYRKNIKNIAALGHDWDDGARTKEPTCVMPGTMTYTCKRMNKDADGNETLCGHKKTELITSLGHLWTTDADGKEAYTVEVEPTCTLSGRKSVHCEREGCNTTKNTSSIKPLGHDWDEDTVQIDDPTCTREGSALYTCKREVPGEDGAKKKCGTKMKRTLPPLGHKFDTEWTTDLEPTCGEPGKKSYHCLNSWTDEDGKEIQCDVVSKPTMIQPKGHSWGAWSTVTAASHGVAGQQRRTCGTCGAAQNRAVADGHVMGDDGKCKSCGVSIVQERSTYGDWEYLIDETEGTVLLKKYIGTKEDLLIPATMEVEKKDGTFDTYTCKFAGGYERRTSSGVFAANKKCQIKSVSFEDDVMITDMANMFYGCTDLEIVLHIPSGVTNMLGTFKDCTSLKFVGTLPADITELQETFEGCTSMVTPPAIPKNVTNLYGTFKNCDALAQAPELSGLTALTNLSFTFSGCTNLGTVPALPETVTEMTDTFRETALLDMPEDIPEGVTKLTTTFYGCNSLEFISDAAFEKLPSTLVTMEYTFKNCKNLTYAPELPSTVTKQTGVFDGCEKKVSAK